jgi:multidrug efflux system outer membrane protein
MRLRQIHFSVAVFAVAPAAVFAVMLAGCTMGPNYKRPLVKTPDNFRAPDPLPPQQATSLADLKWFEVFKDENSRI